MRMLPEVEKGLTDAITRIATKTPNLRDTNTQAIILELCRKCYRLGVAEFQEPIKLELDGPGPSDWES